MATFSAQSRSTSLTLTWTDGVWTGDPVAVVAAREFHAAGKPLDVHATLPPVTASDGLYPYAVAVARRVLGPVNWTVHPVGFDDTINALLVDDPDELEEEFE